MGPIMLRCLFAGTILIVGTTLNSFEDKEPKNINIRTLKCSVLQCLFDFIFPWNKLYL